MSLPNTILIGAQKAGTSSLYDWLSQHKDIFAPQSMKDYHHYCDLSKKEKNAFAKAYSNHGNEKVVLHGAANYYLFPDVAEKLYSLNPNLKIILTLRNPIKRAVSAHQFLSKLGFEKNSFEDAIQIEKSGLHKTVEAISNFTYLDHGLYYKHLESYLKHFDRDQIKIIIFENLIQNPKEAIQEIFNFLEIESNHAINFDIKNQTGQVKSSKINDLIFDKNNFSFLKRCIKAMIPADKKLNLVRKLRDLNTSTSSPEAKTNYEISTDMNSELFSYFEKDVLALSKSLKIDLLSLWFDVSCEELHSV